MLISVFQGTFNGAHAFQGTAIQIANFIQMKGACVCRFCFRWLFVVRSLCAAVISTRCKLFAFAVVRCYCLRVGALVCACTLFEAVYLPFARLLCFCSTFVRLARFSAFMWLVLQPRLWQPILCALRADIQRLGGAKIDESRGTSPRRLRGCVL